MAKRHKPTIAEMNAALTSLTAYQREATALRLFAESLTPPPGWSFVRSARNLSAFLIFVDTDLHVSHFDTVIGSVEWGKLKADLYRLNADSMTDLDSYIDAVRAADAWRREHMPSAAPPAAPDEASDESRPTVPAPPSAELLSACSDEARE